MRYQMDGPGPAARSGPDETRDRTESKIELGNEYLEEEVTWLDPVSGLRLWYLQTMSCHLCQDGFISSTRAG